MKKTNLLYVFGLMVSAIFIFPNKVLADEVIARTYIPISSNTTALYTKGQKSLLIKDYLSSTRVVDTKNQKQLMRYFPYGSDGEGNEMSLDRQFTGHRLVDNTGVYQAGARFYSPQLGQFIQADTVEGPNRYMYAAGNPIMHIDPDGHQCITPSEYVKCANPRSNRPGDSIDLTKSLLGFSGSDLQAPSTPIPYEYLGYMSFPLRFHPIGGLLFGGMEAASGANLTTGGRLSGGQRLLAAAGTVGGGSLMGLKALRAVAPITSAADDSLVLYKGMGAYDGADIISSYAMKGRRLGFEVDPAFVEQALMDSIDEIGLGRMAIAHAQMKQALTIEGVSFTSRREVAEGFARQLAEGDGVGVGSVLQVILPRAGTRYPVQNIVLNSLRYGPPDFGKGFIGNWLQVLQEREYVNFGTVPQTMISNIFPVPVHP